MTHGEMLTGLDRVARLYGSWDQAVKLMTRLYYENALESGDASPLIQLSAELAWHEDHRPCYQLAPSLSGALQGTSLNMLTEHVRFPHRSFALELPLGTGGIMDPGTGKRLLAVLVSAVWAGEVLRTSRQEWNVVKGGTPVFAQAPDGKNDFRLCLVQRWEGEDDTDPPWFLTTFKIGENVGEVASWGIKAPFRDLGPGGTPRRTVSYTTPSRETLNRIVRLSIGAALFAVGANSMFLQEVPEERRRRRRRERQERRGRAVNPEDFKERRWALGANIRLPGPGVRLEGETEELREARGLRWSHLRQGHLRWVRCGPRSDWHYELRYIAPTVVKPELGFPEGYRARGHTLDQPDEGPK